MSRGWASSACLQILRRNSIGSFRNKEKLDSVERTVEAAKFEAPLKSVSRFPDESKIGWSSSKACSVVARSADAVALLGLGDVICSAAWCAAAMIDMKSSAEGAPLLSIAASRQVDLRKLGLRYVRDVEELWLLEQSEIGGCQLLLSAACS